MIIAMKAVTSVPNSSAAIPNWTGFSSGSQCWMVKKLTVLARSAGTELQTRKTAIAAMITRTVGAGGRR